jgi:hypothetical protein
LLSWGQSESGPCAALLICGYFRTLDSSTRQTVCEGLVKSLQALLHAPSSNDPIATGLFIKRLFACLDSAMKAYLAHEVLASLTNIQMAENQHLAEVLAGAVSSQQDVLRASPHICSLVKSYFIEHNNEPCLADSARKQGILLHLILVDRDAVSLVQSLLLSYSTPLVDYMLAMTREVSSSTRKRKLQPVDALIRKLGSMLLTLETLSAAIMVSETSHKVVLSIAIGLSRFAKEWCFLSWTSAYDSLVSNATSLCCTLLLKCCPFVTDRREFEVTSFSPTLMLATTSM